MLIDSTELLYRISELSPLCREPQVFMASPDCNCMIGVDGVRKVIMQMMKEGLET